MRYGYARVSTKSQNLDRQIAELDKVGVDKIFQEKESGKSFDRQQYRSLIRTIKKGDEIIILSIDRLGRNYEEILVNWQLITQKKCCDIQVLDMPLLNTKSQVNGLDGKFISNLVLQILSYVAQKERDNNKIRQAQGIKIAKEKGIKFGRPKAYISSQANEYILKVKNHELSASQAIYESGLSRGTFYRRLKEYQNDGEN